jgi:hypothetical protein
MHRSVLGAREYAGMRKRERIHASTLSSIHLELRGLMKGSTESVQN